MSTNRKTTLDTIEYVIIILGLMHSMARTESIDVTALTGKDRRINS